MITGRWSNGETHLRFIHSYVINESNTSKFSFSLKKKIWLFQAKKLSKLQVRFTRSRQKRKNYFNVTLSEIFKIHRRIIKYIIKKKIILDYL
jgi:hypothetical protein